MIETLRKVLWLNMHYPERVVIRFPIKIWFPRQISEFEGSLFSFAVVVEEREVVETSWEADQAYKHQDKDWGLDADDIPF